MPLAIDLSVRIGIAPLAIDLSVRIAIVPWRDGTPPHQLQLTGATHWTAIRVSLRKPKPAQDGALARRALPTCKAWVVTAHGVRARPVLPPRVR